jgi:hypothetical protein
MLQKIKIFIIIGVCSVYIVNNTTAQDKKVFDNVGVYFSPQIQAAGLWENSSEINLRYGGLITGIGSNANLIDRFSIFIKAGYGSVSFIYDYENWITPDYLTVFNKYESEKLQTCFMLRYNITNNYQNKKYGFYTSAGTIVNMHFNEKVFNIDQTRIHTLEKPRLFNILMACELGVDYNLSNNLRINMYYSFGLRIFQNKMFWNHWVSDKRLGVYGNSGTSIGLIYLFNNSK